MKKRIAVVAFLLTTAITTAASAELSLGMGTRWTAFRNNIAVMVPADVGGASSAGDGHGNLAYFTPNAETALDAYFMLAFSKKFGLYLQLDYMNTSWACTGDNTGDCDNGDDDFGDAAFSTFGLELGIKFYFAEPRRAAISPLLTFGGFAYFSSVTGSESDEDLQIAMSDLSSPLGLRLAIGVEYNFSNNFSVGAEVFGLRFATASTSVGEGSEPAAEPDADTSYTSLSMYTALTLNFRFYGLFRVYTREEEEQGRQEEAEDRQENQQWQQQQNQWNQQGNQQQQNQQQNQWQQQQNPNQQWQQQQNPNQQWQQQTPPPQDPNQQWQQPQGGTPPPVQ